MLKQRTLTMFIFFLGILTLLPACWRKPGKYKCLTETSGLIPLKVIISRYPTAPVYSSADTSGTPGSSVRFYQPYYVFEIKETSYKVGANPFDKTSVVGWIKKNDALLWTTNQAMQFDLKHNWADRRFWENKSEIGSTRFNYILPTNAPDFQYPFPIIASEGRKYQLALDYRNLDGTDKGAAIGWTQELRLGEEAFPLCYISKGEFAARIEELQHSVQNLKEDKSDDPVRDILKNVLKLNLGSGTDTDSKKFNVLQMIGQQAPIPVAQQNPADIRSNQARYERKVEVMRQYLQDNDYWDQYGFGRIPIDLVN